MSKLLPLLIFPKAKTIEPSKRKPRFGGPNFHFPDHKRQVDRLKASISKTVTGLEPETALIIEIVGSVENFRQAVETAGLEWIGEWDIEDMEADDDFYIQENEKRTEKKLKRQLFVSFLDQKGKEKLLSLWETWKSKIQFQRGETKWRDVFNQAYDIRQWGIEETLKETGMIDKWQDLIEGSINEEEPITFQIELFYRKNEEKRKKNEKDIERLLKKIGGKKLSAFIDMSDIAFHAVKAELPAKKIKDLLQQIKTQKESKLDIQLFKFSGIMYFLPTGQSIAVSEKDTTGEKAEFPKGKPKLPPVAAILDGVPQIKHDALNERILIDDPDNLSAEYQPGERRHGTSMASLVIHGDLSDPNPDPLSSQVYHLPVM